MFTRWLTVNLPKVKPKPRTLALWALALLMILAQGCALLPKEPEEEVLPEITPPKLSQKPEYTVKTETMISQVRGVGKIMSMQEEALFFTLEGQNYRVKDIYVNTGDFIEAGQTIAELDVTDLRNQLRTEELAFRSEEIRMKQTLRNANEMTAEELEQAKIEFEQNRTDLLELREKIERSQLKAPFSGTIVSLTIDRGDSVEAYAQVGLIADLNELTVAAEISSNDLEKIAPGMETLVDINAAGQHAGTVERLPLEESNDNRNNYPPYYNNQQPETESIDEFLLVKLDSWPEGVTRGTPLSIAIITNRKENAVVIPPSALRTYGGRTYVQVAEEDGSKREVDVEVGQQTSTQVEIVKGLEPGQKVVGR